MNFNTIKMGFEAYLKEKLADENKELAIANSDISIFMYSNEFKEYVSQELNTDANLTNMSVSDILEMEIVNGKLMTDEEAAEAERVLSGTDDEEKTTTENTEQEVTPTVENTTQETTNQNINGEAATEQQLFFQGFMNDLIGAEDVQKIIDTDSKDGISEEELAAFMQAIGSQDGDSTNITLDEVFSAINGIKDNTFKLDTQETTKTETVEEPTTQETTTEAIPQSSNSSSSSGGGGNFSYSANNNTSTVQEKNAENMTLDELKTELTSVEEVATEQEQSLNEALGGTSETLANLQVNIDEAYEAYKEALGSELAEELEDIETRLADKEKELVNNDQAIWEQENKITECESSYEDAKATTAAIEGQIGALQSQLSGLDDSEENAAAKAEIEAKIGELEQKKTEAQAAEQAALDKLNEAKEALEGENGLLQQQEKLNEELKAIELEKTEFEKKLPEEDKAIQEAKTNYETAKQNFKTEQANEVIAARESLKTSKDYINALNSAINEKENEQLVKDYTVKTNGKYNEEEGQRLVEAAKEMLARYGSSTGYCATGVSRTISIAYGISMGGHGYQWDTNMDKLVEQGMFAEVTSDYATSDELSNLPAGAVVCWENTGGTNGGGAQYGHVAIADGNGGEISDHYQKNIYKSVGGSSTNYRVFIPI